MGKKLEERGGVVHPKRTGCGKGRTSEYKIVPLSSSGKRREKKDEFPQQPRGKGRSLEAKGRP